MSPEVKKIVLGAAAGAFGAFAADVHAWQRARKVRRRAGFDWPLAVSRWAMGAATGALGVYGITQA